MSRKIIYPILIVLIVSGLYYFENHYDFDKTPQTEEVFKEIDRIESNFDNSFLPHSTTGELVHHQFYSLSYSSKHQQAEWVAYRLHPNHLSENSFDRPYFEIDKKVKGGSADWRNYRGSGYDRGHLCPAGDRRFSYEAYAETFLTSNASPQDSKFNAGVWNRLEIQIRHWVPKTGELYIITGGVLKEGLKTIGKDNVSIPDYFFKVVVGNDGTTPKAIAFLIPNKPSGKSLSTFVTPISQIEKLTGIPFFENLPLETAAQLRGPVDYTFWKLK